MVFFRLLSHLFPLNPEVEDQENCPHWCKNLGRSVPGFLILRTTLFLKILMTNNVKKEPCY
jgi:hypothetical protein